MRVWDCDPRALAAKHLQAEWLESLILFRAVAAIKDGGDPEKIGWGETWEAIRFTGRIDGLALLVARRDFIREAADERGFSFIARDQREDTERLYVAEESASWMEFTAKVGWPLLVAQRPATPWGRDGVEYQHYRLKGPYADGVFWTPPAVLSPDRYGYGSDKDGTADPGPWAFTDKDLGLTEEDAD